MQHPHRFCGRHKFGPAPEQDQRLNFLHESLRQAFRATRLPLHIVSYDSLGQTIRFFRTTSTLSQAASVLRYSQKKGPEIACKALKRVQILRISFQQAHFLRRQSIPSRFQIPFQFHIPGEAIRPAGRGMFARRRIRLAHFRSISHRHELISGPV